MQKYLTYAALYITILLLPGCGVSTAFEPNDGPPTRYVDVSNIPDATPKPEPKSRYGNPSSYVVNGTQYTVLNSSKHFHTTGIASWYGTKFHNKRTSSGEPYDMYKMTAANTILPIPTYVQVINLENGHRIIVKVNDRGPFEKNRVIDLSYVAAAKLGMLAKGTALVEINSIDTKNNTTPHDARPMIYLQVGAYSTRASAQHAEEKINQSISAPCTICPGNVNDQIVYRVQIGPIADVNTSDRVSNQLQMIGFGQPITLIKDDVL